MCECVRTRDEYGEWLTLCPIDTDMYDEREERRAALSEEAAALRAQNAELLEALHCVKNDVEMREDNGISKRSYAKIVAAIAKVKGEDQS